MKSLPENEMFNALGNRLRDFTEDPDDEVWRNISRAIPEGNPHTGRSWASHWATAAILALFFLLWSGQHDELLPDGPLQPDRNKPSVVRGFSGENKTAMPEDCVDGIKGRYEINATNNVVNRHRVERRSDLNQTKLSFESDDKTENQSGQTIREGNDSITYAGIRDSNKMMDSTVAVKTDHLLQDSLHQRIKSTPQPLKKKKVKKLHTTFYMSLTPSLSYLKISPLKNDDLVINGLAPDGIFSVNRLGFGADAGFQHRFAKRWEVYVGVNYYQQNQQITYQYQTESMVIEPGNENMYSVAPGQAEKHIDYTMRNAGVAAGVFYRIKDGRLQHKAGAGLQYQHGFLTTQREADYYNSQSAYLNYQLTYRVEYQINKQLSAFLQPNLTYTTQAQERLDAPFTVNPYRAGIGLGFTYQF